MDEKHLHYLREGERVGARYIISPPRRVPAGQAGLQMGLRAGSSLEFREHREYQPGDDVRRIDWHAYARSDRLTVKLHQEEITPHLDVVLDGSRSMCLAETPKARATLGLAAALVTAAASTGFTHDAWTATDRLRQIQNGNQRPSQWDGLALDGQAGLAPVLREVPVHLRRPGVRILLSDLLWPGDPHTVISCFAARSTAIAVVQVLSAGDLEPPEPGYTRLVDSETGEIKSVFIDATVRQKYRDAFSRHQQAWHRACRQTGAVLVTFVAEKLVQDWRLDDLMATQLLSTRA